jgi:hypothetical protein
MIRRFTRALGAVAIVATVTIPAAASVARADLADAGHLAPVSVPHITVPSDLQGTTVEGNAFVLSADCSVSATVSGDNQASTGLDAGALSPSSSDCVRREAIDSPGANTTDGSAVEETGNFSDIFG